MPFMAIWTRYSWQNFWLRACSHEAGFRDVALPLNQSFINLGVFIRRGWAGSVPEILVFPTGIGVIGLEILPYEHVSPVTGMNYGDPDCIVLLYLLYFADHNHPIYFHFISKTMIGANAITFLCIFALFLIFRARTRPQDLWLFLISETGLKFLIWTQGEIGPGNWASPVNRDNVKRP